MKSLRESSHFDFDYIIDSSGDSYYLLKEDILYTSKRYNKTKTAKAGMKSDGASGPAEDIVSKAWWIHDALCNNQKWDDGTLCTNWEASMVLHDILMKENRWIRAKTWFVFTYIYRIIKTRKL